MWNDRASGQVAENEPSLTRTVKYSRPVTKKRSIGAVRFVADQFPPSPSCDKFMIYVFGGKLSYWPIFRGKAIRKLQLRRSVSEKSLEFCLPVKHDRKSIIHYYQVLTVENKNSGPVRRGIKSILG